METRVWYRQLDIFDLLLYGDEQIQIQGTRTPAHRISDPTLLAFDGLQVPEDCQRRKLSLQRHHGVDKIRLIRGPHRRIAIQR